MVETDTTSQPATDKAATPPKAARKTARKTAPPTAAKKAGVAAVKKAGKAVSPGAAPSPRAVTTRAKPARTSAPSEADNGSAKTAASKPEASDSAAKKKPKLVRDSFTMPRADFDLIAQLKDRALGFKQAAKKSELLRAGLHALSAMPDAKLKATLSGLTALKAGRPKKND